MEKGKLTVACYFAIVSSETKGAQISDIVHGNGCYIFMQLWSVGRVAVPAVLQKYGHDVVGPSAIALDDNHAKPRELSIDEIKEYVHLYAQAARNAIRAGFDGRR